MSTPTWLQLSESWDRQRAAAAEQKIREEEMARRRKEWEFQDKQNAAIDTERAAAIAAASRPLADANSPQGFKAGLGLEVPQSAAAMRRGDERFKYGEADVYTPEAPGSQPQFALDQQANTISALNMAGRDPRQIAEARKADTTNRLAADAARISSYAQTADEAELKDLMGKVTLDKRNKYETDFDPKTGLTRIKQGETAVELSRPDLGKFLAAQFRMKNGDLSASADIEAIDGKLAKLVADSLQVSSALANSGNSVTTSANQMKNDNLRTGSALATAGAAREDKKRTDADRELIRTAGVAFEKARQVGDKAGMDAATLDLIKAGGINPNAASVAQHNPADILKARALVAQKIYPSEGEALDAIISKPDDLYKSYKDSAMKASMSADSAIAAAKVNMADDGWVRSSSGTWKRSGGVNAATGAVAAPVASFKSVAEVTAAKDKLKPGDVITVGGQTVVYKPK